MATWRYKIKYTSIRCHRESDEIDEADTDDEVYAIFVFTNQSDFVRVHRTQLYVNVRTGEAQGGHQTDDNVTVVDFPDDQQFDDQNHGLFPRRLFVAILEHDQDTNIDDLVAAVEQFATANPQMTRRALRTVIRQNLCTQKYQSLDHATAETHNSDDIVRVKSKTMGLALLNAIGSPNLYSRKRIAGGGEDEGKYQFRFTVRVQPVP